MVDGSLGGLHIMGGTGFHFNETKNLTVPADEIDLPATERRTIIAGDHHVALLSEVEVGIFLTPAADLLMQRQLVLWATASQNDRGHEEWFASVKQGHPKREVNLKRS